MTKLMAWCNEQKKLIDNISCRRDLICRECPDYEEISEEELTKRWMK